MHRIVYLDLIKVIGILSVVLIHTTGPIMYRVNDLAPGYWMTGNIFEAIAMMGVPLFFMVSGALLLSKNDESLQEFFKKRISRVIIPLILWSLIYILFKKFIIGAGYYNISILTYIANAFGDKAYYHLGFLYQIIGLYMFVPIIRVVVHNTKTKLLIYWIILWIIFGMINPFIKQLFGYKLYDMMPMMSGLFGYMILGYIMHKLKINKKIYISAIGLILLSTVISIIGTDYISHLHNKYNALFSNYIGVFTMGQAIGWFIMLKYLSSKYINYIQIQDIISQLSIASFGVYLIHPIILYFLQKLGIYALNGYNPLIIIPIVFMLTIITSYLFITYIVLKMPYLRVYLLGEKY